MQKKTLLAYISLIKTAPKSTLRAGSGGSYLKICVLVHSRDARYVSTYKRLIKDHEELINASNMDSDFVLQSLSSSYMRSTMAT